MKRALSLSVGFALMVVLSACGDAGRIVGPSDSRPGEPPASSSPSPAPIPPPVPVPPQGPNGTLRLVGLSPEAGASFAVRECQHGERTCADGWRGTFEVLVDRDLEHTVLTVHFYDGAVPCGYAAMDQYRVPAGQWVTFRPTTIFLSDEFTSFSPCALPATTTRLVATLWSDAEHATWFTQEFVTTYRFVRP